MARQLLVLALIFFAIVGMVSAAADAPAAGADSAVTAHGPSTDDAAIGNTDGSSDAAPVGGPVSPETFTTVSPAQGPGASAASSLELSSTFASATFATFVGAFIF